MTWAAKVTLINPRTGDPYDGVTPDVFGGSPWTDTVLGILGASGVGATIGTSRSSLSLWLSLPGDERLGDAAAHVQENLPFQLSAKHWRRWRLARDGASYRSTKTKSPLASAVP